MWGTIEADAWSRGFGYDDYLNLYQRSVGGVGFFCAEAYELICKAFEVQMEYNLGA